MLQCYLVRPVIGEGEQKGLCSLMRCPTSTAPNTHSPLGQGSRPWKSHMGPLHVTRGHRPDQGYSLFPCCQPQYRLRWSLQKRCARDRSSGILAVATEACEVYSAQGDSGRGFVKQEFEFRPTQ